VVRGVKAIGRMGDIPGMINMRKDARGDGRGECELKGIEGLRVRRKETNSCGLWKPTPPREEDK
jgi:hypothetical protein